VAKRIRRVGLLALAILAGSGPGCGSGKKAVICPAGQTDCGGTCRDLQADVASCGFCGHLCMVDGLCNAGVCECPAATVLCGSACVDTSTSPSHCGSCAHDCGAGTCAGGACTCAAAPPTVMDCTPAKSPQCRDTAADRVNCGACDAACPPTQVCASSACQDCPAGQSVCGNACKDLATDHENCSACGRACGAVQICSGGACTCPMGQSPCGSACTDLSSDEANCGTCGHACGAGQVCSGGTCSCTAGVTCGPACCPAGAACACSGGTACQTRHDNGLGQFFYDCNPLNTWTPATAQEAATAWNPGGSATVPACLNCLAWQTATQCATWCYAGSSFPGQATVNTSMNACLCPPGPGPVSSWH
jgi:hypothetical protein